MEEFQDYRYILDDFQHQIENKIRNHKNEPDFPQMDEKLSQEELDDFLFDYQAALDSEGTERTQYTIAGVLITLPIIVLSAFPEDSLPVKGYQAVLFGVAIGLLLFGIYKITMKAVVRDVRKKNTRKPVLTWKRWNAFNPDVPTTFYYIIIMEK